MSLIWPGRGAATSYISAPPSAGWIARRRRSLVILGSTGSIGGSALRVARLHPDRLRVMGLACARSAAALAAQAAEFRPDFLAVLDDAAADALRAALKEACPAGYHPEILIGPDGYAAMASLPEADTVLSAQVGAAGLSGTMAAVLAGKVVALANKESLVLAGDVVRRVCAARGAVILPVDSEHNAIFQCLAGRDDDVDEIILTASGGPFLGRKRGDLRHVTPDEAVRHPRWSMGAKISVDSATMMNKALEVVEAFHLYGLPAERIRVVIHPQSLAHSMVRFRDGSMLAQLGTADMRLPIAHCLLWPECLPADVPALDLTSCGPLEFLAPDEDAFPSLRLARRALETRGGMCAVMNAANDAAVADFLAGRCAFTEITDRVEAAMDAHGRNPVPVRATAPGTATAGTSEDDVAAEARAAVERIMELDRQSRGTACPDRAGEHAC